MPLDSQDCYELLKLYFCTGQLKILLKFPNHGQQRLYTVNSRRKLFSFFFKIFFVHSKEEKWLSRYLSLYKAGLFRWLWRHLIPIRHAIYTWATLGVLLWRLFCFNLFLLFHLLIKRAVSIFFNRVASVFFPFKL